MRHRRQDRLMTFESECEPFGPPRWRPPVRRPPAPVCSRSVEQRGSGARLDSGSHRLRGVQYHWFNRGCRSFDDFLATLKHSKRKSIRKERRDALQGLEIRALRGSEIGAADWDAMWAFYQDTGSRKWGRPYLTREFFELVGERMGDAVLLFLAYRSGQPIAGALNFVGPDALYGRYWGCTEEVPFLHFELCYYQAVEWAIDHGLKCVQAGAQGEHKVARGYEPVVTNSAHFIPDRSFRNAVAGFLQAEREGVAAEVEWLRRDLPYRSSSSE